MNETEKEQTEAAQDGQARHPHAPPVQAEVQDEEPQDGGAAEPETPEADRPVGDEQPDRSAGEPAE